MSLRNHWNKIYSKSAEENLGWYETDLEPTKRLILKTELDKSSAIINMGAGSTLLVDELLNNEYSNIIATDISEIALKKLEDRVGNKRIKYIVDDLTNPSELLNITKVDLLIDRAVLHFFTDKKDQTIYFDLINEMVKSNGYVIFAEYNLDGASSCAGLPVYRYSKELLSEKLGINFKLIESFNYTLITQSGAEKPYIYTLFKKV